MSKSQGSVMSDWQRLLSAVQDNADRLPDTQVERSTLEAALAKALEAKTLQDLHRAEKQRATQLLQKALAEGADAAAQLRGAAMFKLGPRNEKLVQFQIAPLRKQGPRKGNEG